MARCTPVLILGLMAALLLAACAPAAPTAAPVTATQPPAFTAPPASTATSPPPTLVPTPSPAPTATPVPTQAATPTTAPAAITLECAAGQPWSSTQTGATVALCIDPSPPKLGERSAFSVQLLDGAGAAISDAVIALTLVGGMAGMEGDHDEDFSLDLDHQGDGLYGAAGVLGPSDLVLTGVVIRVQRASAEWTFTIPPSDLSSP